ncbi:MAG: alpha/beta hydrolase [Candidatus Dormibacteraeota bacterium]|nr:alpha/beta hydrolase [Candidatus Dormibacteraeota bacterium]
MEERTVDAGAVRLSVRDWPGTGLPVVALHGLASNSRWWDLVADRLSPRHRVLALDLRGHGLSDRPESGYSIEEVAADVAAAIATLGIGPHVVAGHSWGASIALRHGAEPGVVGVVCVDGGISDLRAVFGGSWSEAEPMMTPPEFSGVTADALKIWAAAGALADGSDGPTATAILLGNFEDVGGELRPRLALNRHMLIARSLFEARPAELLAAVRCPVLLLPATQPPEQLSLRQAWVEDALTVLDGRGKVAWIDGGHDLPVQRPAEVAATMGDWISRLPSPDQPSTTS